MILRLLVKLALVTFVSTATTAVDNSTICTGRLLFFVWNFVPFGVVVWRLGERFILQGKVAALISRVELSLYCWFLLTSFMLFGKNHDNMF